MPNIFFSKAAAEKITEDTKYQPSSNAPLIPRLLYHHRSYSTLNDGRTIEHGPGLTLSFVEPKEANREYYLPLYLRDGLTLLVGPASFFGAGTHEIDWAGRKFTLNSVATDPT